MAIHALAQVHPGAKLGSGVSVGPWARIDEHVVLGDDCEVASHAIVSGHSTFGRGNVFHPFTVVGGAPQDLSYKGEPTRLTVGEGNIFREYVTVNTGTAKDLGETRIGSRCLFMAACHVAHDCIVGDHVVLANGVLLGGHITLEDRVSIGGATAIHHFVTVGENAFLGGMTRVALDVPPFMIVEGNPAEIRGLNVVGLKRRGVGETGIEALKDAYKLLCRSGLTRGEAIGRLRAAPDRTPEVEAFLQFLLRTDRGKNGRAREGQRTW